MVENLQISRATKQNWIRLGSDRQSKLARRANKTQSSKRIVATNYLKNNDAMRLLDMVKSVNAPIEDIIYSLSVSYLRWAKIIDKDHVKQFLSRYSQFNLLNLTVPAYVWSLENDVLGFIYQSLIAEGERISTGQYYTSKEVVSYILDGKVLNDGETFLDPCCGSGAFLLGVKTNNPTCLYGFDINPIAVLIASTNLLVKYSDYTFAPNVYCLDFLKNDLLPCGTNRPDGVPFYFDNVYTNPPWGSDKVREYSPYFPEIKSKERSSMVVVESLRRLSKDGQSCFLLPTSILKINSHKDIRKHIISSTGIQRIDLFDNNFNGVYTDYFCIRLSASKSETQTYTVYNGKDAIEIELSDEDIRTGAIPTTSISRTDADIIQKIESLQHDDLTHSRWALGIVTGDNKHKLKDIQSEGLEPIYTGKEIRPFNLEKERAYILYNPESFQQCARDELYRAQEKLLYRFIAKYPIVAYDDKQSICLNSANILIPDLDGISIRSAASLLNSSLYRFYYSIKFTDIKVLKGNLQKLKFPKLTPQQDKELSDFAGKMQLTGFDEQKQLELDMIVDRIFGINDLEQDYIRKNLR